MVIVVQPVERPARAGKQQVRLLPKHSPIRITLPNCSPIFDGSQDWVIAHNDVVAGSSPAPGTNAGVAQW